MPNDKHIFGSIEAWAIKAKIRKARRKGIGSSLNKHIVQIVKDLFKESDTDEVLLLIREITVDLVAEIDVTLARRHDTKENKRLAREAKRAKRRGGKNRRN